MKAKCSCQTGRFSYPIIAYSARVNEPRSVVHGSETFVSSLCNKFALKVDKNSRFSQKHSEFGVFEKKL